MLKFLSWLLVPLIPLVFLLVGQHLKSNYFVQLRWTQAFDSSIVCQGFTDHGKTLLVAETENEAVLALIGIDVENGVIRLRKPLPIELTRDQQLCNHLPVMTPDESKLLFVDWKRSELLLYDWVQQQVAMKYQTGSENGTVNQPIQQNGTIIAMGASSQNGVPLMSLMLWDGNQTKPFVLNIPNGYLYFGLSSHGSLAYYSTFSSSGHSLVLFDVKSKSRLQEIDGGFYEVRWAADDKSFIALRNDQNSRGFVAERFQRVDKTFQLVPGSEVRMGHGKFNAIANRPFITLSASVHDDPVRELFAAIFGSVIEDSWPDGQVVQLHEKHSGQLIQKLSFPKHPEGSSTPFPHVSGLGLAMTYPNSIDYWQINPTANWYPMLGLILGVVLATLLAWKLVFHQRTNRHPKPDLPA